MIPEWKASLAALFCCGLLFVVSGEVAGAPPQVEQSLLRALSLDSRTKQRLAPSGEVLRELIAAGYLSRKPNLRFDYNDYRLLRKPAKFFGFDIQLIEEEYMAAYVGCCVNPGVGLMLSGKGDLGRLKAFAKSNGCSVESPADATGIPDDLKVSFPPGPLTYLSCRERDVPN